MFALVFRFPAGRYHGTPWGRNVNEADVAWPPESWRLLRALIAAYWRKGDRARWFKEDLARLIDALAETLPLYHLPTGSIHAHTRHYMPVGKLDKGREKTTLVFDAFVRLRKDATIVASWPTVILDADLFAFAADLASAIGYLGRAESWTECKAVADWHGEANCRPADSEFTGEPVRLLAPLSPAAVRGRAQTAYQRRGGAHLCEDDETANSQEARARSEKDLPEQREPSGHTANASRRCARTRHRRLSGPGMEPAARRPRSRLRSRSGGRPWRSLSGFRSTPPFQHKTKHADRRSFPPGRSAPPPCRRHRQDWGTDAPRGALTVRLAIRHQGSQDAESAVAGFRARRRQQATQGTFPSPCFLVAGGRGFRRPDRSYFCIHCGWHQ